jgi:hypothetical protein
MVGVICVPNPQSFPVSPPQVIQRFVIDVMRLVVKFVIQPSKNPSVGLRVICFIQRPCGSGMMPEICTSSVACTSTHPAKSSVPRLFSDSTESSSPAKITGARDAHTVVHPRLEWSEIWSSEWRKRIRRGIQSHHKKHMVTDQTDHSPNLNVKEIRPAKASQ